MIESDADTLQAILRIARKLAQDTSSRLDGHDAAAAELLERVRQLVEELDGIVADVQAGRVDAAAGLNGAGRIVDTLAAAYAELGSNSRPF